MLQSDSINLYEAENESLLFRRKAPTKLSQKFVDRDNISLGKKLTNFTQNFEEIVSGLKSSLHGCQTSRNSKSNPNIIRIITDSTCATSVRSRSSNSNILDIQTDSIRNSDDFYKYTEHCIKLVPDLLSCLSGMSPYDKNKVEFNFDSSKKIAVLNLEQTLVYLKPKKTIYSNDMNAQEFEILNRPYLIELLEGIRNQYELVVFSSLAKHSADKIIDSIDPDHKYFSLRLYKNSCTSVLFHSKEVLVKDLRIFSNVPISKIVVIDYSLLRFALHLMNGIPIMPYTGQKNDQELFGLLHYLSYISTFEDLRRANEIFISLKIDFNHKDESIHLISDGNRDILNNSKDKLIESAITIENSRENWLNFELISFKGNNFSNSQIGNDWEDLTPIRKSSRCSVKFEGSYKNIFSLFK